MGTPPVNPLPSRAEIVLTRLVFPILMLLTGIVLILHDSILDPPTEKQGETGIGVLLVILASGRGLDLLPKIKGG